METILLNEDTNKMTVSMKKVLILPRGNGKGEQFGVKDTIRTFT